MNPTTTKALVEKYRDAEREIASLRGQFSLFGLFEERDAPGKLDLIVSAPWLNTNRSGLLDIAQYLPHLTSEEGSIIGRVVSLPPSDGFVQEINRMVETDGQIRETGASISWYGDTIHSFIISSHKRPMSHQEHEYKLAVG